MKANATKLGFELKVVLEQEIALFDNLLEIMQEERELLVRFQPNQLLELNKRKELLVLQQNYLESSRATLSRELIKVLELDENATLKQIAAALGGELGKSFVDLHSSLTAVVDAIGQLAVINRHLIEFSIKSVKGSVAFLKRRFFSAETYSAAGVINQEIAQLSSLNNRA